MTDIEVFPFGWRMANAVVSYVRYIEKMLLPRKLAVLYPLTGNLPPFWLIVFSACLVLGITILVIMLSRSRRYLLVGWLWFVGTLVPVIGLVHVGRQVMADRYTYVPLTGLFIIIAWGAGDITAMRRHQKIPLTVAAAIVIAALVICTDRQLRYWRNSMELFQHAVEVTNGNYVCLDNIGLALTSKGQFEQAIEYHKKSIEVYPEYAEAWNNLGAVYGKIGRPSEAISVLDRAIELRPDYAKAYYNLGVVYISLNRWTQAADYLEKTVKLDPSYAEAHHNLGSAYYSLGRFPDAIDSYKRAIAINPNLAEPYNGLGDVYFTIKNYRQAIESFIQATKIKPDYADAHFNLGVVYTAIGQNAQALRQYDILKTLEPKLAEKLLRLINK